MYVDGCVSCVLCTESAYIIYHCQCFLIRCIYANIIITVSEFPPHSHSVLSLYVARIVKMRLSKGKMKEPTTITTTASSKEKQWFQTTATLKKAMMATRHTPKRTTERQKKKGKEGEGEREKKATTSRRIIQFKHTDIRLQPLFVLRYNACATAAILIRTSLRFSFSRVVACDLTFETPTWRKNEEKKITTYKTKIKNNKSQNELRHLLKLSRNIPLITFTLRCQHNMQTCHFCC